MLASEVLGEAFSMEGPKEGTPWPCHLAEAEWALSCPAHFGHPQTMAFPFSDLSFLGLCFQRSFVPSLCSFFLKGMV